MLKPDFKAVFENPTSYLSFICVPDDNEFEGQHFDRKQVGQADSRGKIQKTSFSTVLEHVEKTMSALANADGGLLILGISKTGQITGVDFLGEGEKNALLNPQGITGTVIKSKLHPVTAKGSTINIALFMVESDERTFCYRVKDDAAWLRRGSASIQLHGPELEQVKRDRKVVDFERIQTEVFNPDDIDNAVLEEFIKSRIEGNDNRPLEQVLRDAGAANGNPNDYQWTNAGVLFFTYNPQRVLPQSYIRLLRFECSYEDEDERPTPSFEKDFDGSLTKQIRDFRVFITESGFFKKYEVRSPEGGFTSELEYPNIAIDEAVVNAVVHRDYGISQQPITCEKYTDSFVVKSPGRLLQPRSIPAEFSLTEQMLESFPRNRKIMDWFRLMKDAKGNPYVKAIREGTRRMRDEMKQLGLPSPTYVLKETETIVILHNDALRREVKPTGLASEQGIVSDEFSNLYRLRGLKVGTYKNGSYEQRQIFLNALCNKLEENNWVIDSLGKGKAVVHLKNTQEQLPSSLKHILRNIPAYSLSIRSYHGNYYLVVDYKLRVQSIWNAQKVIAKYGSGPLQGLKAFASVNGKLVRGQIVEVDTEYLTFCLFDSNEKYTLPAKDVFPSLRRDMIDEIVQEAAPGFDLSKAIKKAALSTEVGASRIRASRISSTVSNLAKTIFPLVLGDKKILIDTTPLKLLEHGDGKRAWRIQETQEPDVEFARKRTTANIRDGITSFGAYEDSPRDLDIVAVVQPGFESQMRNLVSRLQSGTYKYRGAERTFSTRIKLAQVSSANGISVDEECRRLIREYPSWTGNTNLNRVMLVHTPEAGFALDDVNSPYYKAKRVLLESGIPCQMVDTPTLQNPNFKDLNLALNIVAKTGVTPWVLPESIPDADFFIGLSYTSSREQLDDRMLGFANVFNHYGRWEFYSGGNGAVPYTEREHHYEELVSSTMEKLSLSEHPTVWFHYSARFSRTDRDAILRGARKIRPKGKYVFVWINSHHPVRLFDQRTETDGSVARGRYVISAPNQIYISTTGYNQYRKILGTPQALEVNVYVDHPATSRTQAPVDHHALARQILSLTKLNWASTDSLCAEPITTKYAKNIAYLTAAFQRQQQGEFRLHDVLERTPWFI